MHRPERQSHTSRPSPTSPLTAIRRPAAAALALVVILGGAPALAESKIPRPVPRPSLEAAFNAPATEGLSGAARIATEPARPSAAGLLPPHPVPRPMSAPPAPRAASGPNRLRGPDAAWRTTLAYAEDAAWTAALAVPGRSNDPHLAAVLLWLSLLDGDRPTDFETVANFLTEHPDWPGEAQIELLAEKLMPSNLPASTRVLWFKEHPPRTGMARLAYLDALETIGPGELLVAEVRRTWREIDMTAKSQAEFLARFGRHLRAVDHQERLDEMLWRGQTDAATRTMPLVSEGWRKLADARIKLRQSRGGVDEAVDAVPAALRNDPGLLYERIRWRRERGLATAARELLFDAPSKPEFEALWWRERSWHIREAMDRGEMRDAYLLAATHVQTRGVAFADAEWLAGWLALRFLDRPGDAFKHFRKLHENVSTPISLGRAAYWAGRAAEALGDEAEARRWYGRGAEHGTTFYGQLAAARLGATGIALPRAAAVEPSRIAAFRARSLVAATEALIRVDRRKLAERFLRTLAYRAADEDESLMVAQLAARSGFVSTAVYAARRAARSGAALVEVGYPLLDPIPVAAPEPALVHAIIRQESAFDTEAVSRAGARGLMQLMPATAKATAKSVGLSYNLGSLLDNPAYNVTLGRAYLKSVVDRFDGHYILAIAAYNAGPGRVDQWIARNGHPASPDVDVIDWIEKIPFSETRNYVQRVLEGLHVYRERLPGSYMVDPAAGGWHPQAVWCVYSCGVLLDRQQAALVRERKP